MSRALLSLEGLQKRFGGIVATDALTLEVHEGEVHSVIGPNGAGKTTLVAQVSGLLAPDAGSIRFDGVDITWYSAARRSRLGLARTFQITSVFRKFTAAENVLLAVQAHTGHSFRFWAPARGDLRLLEPAMAVLEDLGLDARRDVLAGNLSHGEQRRLEIAIALATRPKLLLLDEPTAGMGPEDAERVKQLLDRLRSRYAMLLIEHDMDAVFRLSDRITVLVYGRAIASGTPAEIRDNEEVRRAYLGTEETF
jgi:branched-chain amino acid transport system ATP-binding protein